MKLTPTVIKSLLVASLSAQPLLGALVSSTPSMKEFAKGEEKLVVYNNVPGHEKPVIKNYKSRAKSDIFEIRVRSAATDNEWVQCFTHLTYNRALEMPALTGFRAMTHNHGYQVDTAGWTHSYVNIEMTKNSTVEVEVRRIGEALINGKTVIEKSAVHPIQKVVKGSKKDENGRVYFKINNPGQLVIDINGQFDDHNNAFPTGTPGGGMPGKPPHHAVAFYANPYIEKPVARAGHRIVTMSPAYGTPTKLAPQPPFDSYDTLVFAPGVHFIGTGFKAYPGKRYYIPGDAILHGTFTNEGVDKGTYKAVGENVIIYGYGVMTSILVPFHGVNGFIKPFPGPSNFNPEYAEWNGWPEAKKEDWDAKRRGKGIILDGAQNCKVMGPTMSDQFSIHLAADDSSMINWVKIHSWRVTGDGSGSYSPIEDSFFRTSDDSTYVRNWRRRCTFWKDTNANQIRFINHMAGGVEDCDIIYSRWRNTNGNGNIFEFESHDKKPKLKKVDLKIRNNRFHDKLQNSRYIFEIASAERLTGVTFENMAFYLPLNKKKSIMNGSKEFPYTGELMFKNITFQNGMDGSPPVKLTKKNYKDYFDTNEFVDPSIFED